MRVPAVRIGVGVGLLAVCLGLTGCSLFGKKNSQAGGGGGTPFLGARAEPSAAAPAAAPAAVTPTSSSSGVLAGQVLDPLSRRAGGVPIQIVDLDEPNKSAPKARLDYEATNEGFFLISGLTPGHHYQLIARLKEGNKLLSGTVFATPPNPRLSIYLSEDFTSPSTPDVPKPPSIPGKPEAAKEAKPSSSAPAATIAPPVKAPPGPAGAGAPAGIPGPAANVIPADPSRIARDGGLARGPDIPAYIQGPGQVGGAPNAPVIPPAPGSNRRDTAPGSPIVRAPSEAGGVPLPNVPAPVPFCVLQGRQLDNFALYDLDGRPWEYRHDETGRERTGRLVLLDFWYSSCTPCLQAIPKLVKWQEDYGRYGFQVVGIAYEQAPAGKPQRSFTDQATNVRRVRGRLGINYTTLLGGGGAGPCPVRTQFGVECFPTLVLLNQNGEIVWSSGRNGLDDWGRYKLEMEIRRQLGIKD
jgi:thiol-disulfide isomerase/thioredoxin